jgi:zinc/manganese transport system permease protein
MLGALPGPLALATPHLSWNVVADARDMFRYPFMVNAFRAGSAVAVLSAVVGWFMVLRRQAFVGHTLAIVGFPGAAAAAWLGAPPALGYFAACLLCALVIAALSGRGAGGDDRGEPAIIGLAQAAALATGYLFISLYHGNLEGTNALLFGSFLGVTTGQVVALTVVAVVCVAAVATIGRPLMFASIDPGTALARGIPVATLSVGFLLLLGAAAAGASQITGSLLVFALLVLPPATARRFTLRPGLGIVLAVALGLAVTWVGLTLAYYTTYPIGFWVTSLAFGLYVVVHAVHAVAHRGRHRPLSEQAP